MSMMRTSSRTVACTLAASLSLAGLASANQLPSGAADLANPSLVAPQARAHRALKVRTAVPSSQLGGGVLFDNGSVVNFPGGGPGGADDSRLEDTTLQDNIFGFGHAIATGFRMADDFTIPAGQSWQIDTITFFAYQTGSTTTSTINDIRVQIWDGPPNGGGTVIFGDLATNRFASSAWSNAYRTLESAPGNTQRPIMEVVATINTVLGEGTYWIDWQEGGTLASGPWAPPISIAGQGPTGDALQFNPTPAPGAWAAAIDSGVGANPKGMPFVVEGTASGSEICATPAAAIPDNNPAGVTSTIAIPDVGTVTDVDVKIDATHTWVGDLIFTLEHVDSGTTVTFYDRPGVPASTFGCSGDNIPGVFGDDEGADGAFETGCLNATPAFPADGHFTGNNPLSALDGLALAGDWTLTASDAAAGDTGTLNEWCLVIESDPGPPTEPDIAVDPTDLSSTQEVDTQVVVQLDITNNGDADLDWTIEEAEGLANQSARSLPRRRSGPFRPFQQTVPDETFDAVGSGARGFSTARGASRGSVTPQRPEAPVGTVTITHSATQTITSLNSVSCNSGGFHTNNAYLRRFTLADFGITSDFQVQQVEVGVEVATGTGGTQPVTVNLYTWDPSDPFTYANFTEIGTVDTTVADTTATIVAIPVTGTAPAGSTLVVELFTPSGQPSTASFFIGSNADGQTGPGFIAAADCGITEPTDLGAIGFPNMHMVMNVTGIAGGCGDDLTWVSTSPSAGTTVPLATSTVDVTFDSTGLDLGQILLGSLCVQSNDPDTPTVLVPLTLEVDTMPFLDGFESGDTSEWSASQL
jgi:subtilisin-like proprotein convertase family protein